MSYNTELQANNEELQSILNTVNALPNADSGGNVAYDEAQNLTEEQKAQARENIGAQPVGNYLTEVPEGYAKTSDIPTDEHINGLINTALGVIENGAY